MEENQIENPSAILSKKNLSSLWLHINVGIKILL